MVRPGRDRLSGRVEVDESYVGGEEEGVHGRETTPYLLQKIAELTGGESIRANVALLRNNAAVAAQIAAALSYLPSSQ